MLNKQRTQNWTSHQSILNKAFACTGIAFLLICIIGVIVFHIIDVTEIGRQIREQSISNIYSFSSGMSLLSKLTIVAMILILATSLMQFIWHFRIQKASKTFIGIIYTAYIIGQGISFGFLFLTLKTSELFIVFGGAGGLFCVMALFGYFAKNLSGMGKYLFAGSLFMILFGIVLMILSATHTLNAGANFGISAYLFNFFFFAMGMLILGYIAYDVWRLKQMAQWAEANGTDKDMRFRLIAYFGFRLLTDLIALVWIMARFLLNRR